VTCPRSGCGRPVGRNGAGCHEHFTALVPGFLARALYTTRDAFTKDWLTRQVVHALRDEDWTA
jgi:hypothetical protein